VAFLSSASADGTVPQGGTDISMYMHDLAGVHSCAAQPREGLQGGVDLET